MLFYLYADQLRDDPRLINSMFLDRAAQFRDRLGWDVNVDAKGWEKDSYDNQNPLYVIWKKPDGLHGGSMRVLPTTGPCMVNEHFSELTGTVITSPLIWESTRFCLASDTGKDAVRISAALMLAGCEIGLNFGLNHAVGVFDHRMERIYRKLGWSPEIVGSQGAGRQKTHVGLWEFSKATRHRLLLNAGLTAQISEHWFNRHFGFENRQGMCA